MAGSVVSLSVDDAQVRRMLSKAPESISAGIRRLIEGAAIDIQREERLRAPVAVTGQLRGSIKYAYDADTLSAEIKPDVPYGEDVENGGAPRWVSVKPGTPLEQWARQKGINPYVIQRVIAARGTKAHPFVKPTFDFLLPKVQQSFHNGVADIVRSIQSA